MIFEEKLVRVDDVVHFLEKTSKNLMNAAGSVLSVPEMQAIIASAIAVDKAADAVKLLPTVDVVPVVHARWGRDKDFNTVCTACGNHLPSFPCYNEETDEEWDEQIDETSFCPNCGAKMDGGKSDDA